MSDPRYNGGSDVVLQPAVIAKRLRKFADAIEAGTVRVGRVLDFTPKVGYPTPKTGGEYIAYIPSKKVSAEHVRYVYCIYAGDFKMPKGFQPYEPAADKAEEA